LNSRKACDQAIGYWLSILDRSPDEKVKVEALTSLGTAWSVVGQHEKAEDAWRKLAAHHGENTEEGMGATFALGWSQFRQEDYARSAATMERVIASPASGENTRTWARVNRAFFGIKGGDAPSMMASHPVWRAAGPAAAHLEERYSTSLISMQCNSAIASGSENFAPPRRFSAGGIR